VVGLGLNWSNPVPASGIALAPWLSAQTTSPCSPGLECLEDLIAIALRGILQGVYTWQCKVAPPFVANIKIIWLMWGSEFT
jgi:BirA family biotin operon repressor/biotin-[acetyl-CoA-carboxylase] ligase